MFFVGNALSFACVVFTIHSTHKCTANDTDVSLPASTRNAISNASRFSEDLSTKTEIFTDENYLKLVPVVGENRSYPVLVSDSMNFGILDKDSRFKVMMTKATGDLRNIPSGVDFLRPSTKSESLMDESKHSLGSMENININDANLQLNTISVENTTTVNSVYGPGKSNWMNLQWQRQQVNFQSITKCSYFPYESKVGLKCRGTSVEKVAHLIPHYVTSLYFSHCPKLVLYTKPLLAHLTKLKSLTLKYCGILDIFGRFLQGLTSLEKVSFPYNKIMVMRRNLFRSTPNVSQINLSNNLLIDFSTVAMASKDLMKLKTINFDGNKMLTEIFSNSFDKLRNSSVEELSFVDCALSIVEQGTFEPLGNLKTLKLSINALDRQALKNITKDLTRTRIRGLEMRRMTSIFPGKKFITEELRPLESTKLTLLDMSSNYIMTLPNEAFPSFS